MTSACPGIIRASVWLLRKVGKGAAQTGSKLTTNCGLGDLLAIAFILPVG
jgi:hypothetical protein